ncbi:MAG: hypothetical protein KA105_02515 [Caulobacter sp.]|nr:hypothetical protein [Caulobacter sp.]
MTTPGLTPEVVERLTRLRYGEPPVAVYPIVTFDPFAETEEVVVDALAIARDLSALLARLSHLEEQARKDGEAFAAMFRDPLPGHDADACELMDLIAEVRLAARARLSDREAK